MLLLPELPGLDILSFTMDIYSSETNWHMDIDELESHDVDIPTISGIPPDKNVKAVLFFCDEPFCPPEIGYSILNQYKDAVVAGGYVDNLVVRPKPPKSSEVSTEDRYVNLDSQSYMVSVVIMKKFRDHQINVKGSTSFRFNFIFYFGM